MITVRAQRDNRDCVVSNESKVTTGTWLSFRTTDEKKSLSFKVKEKLE